MPVEQLDLSYNNFTKVPTDGLKIIKTLEILDLSGNMIDTIEAYSFLDLENLKTLFLRNIGNFPI